MILKRLLFLIPLACSGCVPFAIFAPTSGVSLASAYADVAGSLTSSERERITRDTAERVIWDYQRLEHLTEKEREYLRKILGLDKTIEEIREELKERLKEEIKNKPAAPTTPRKILGANHYGI